jgi:predicted RNA-binding Zn-ribbon protein involved in translation (DUF1610 family)
MLANRYGGLKPTKNLQGICTACGAPIDFQVERIGLKEPCPHCGELTELRLAQPAEEPLLPRKVVVLTAITILLMVAGLIACIAWLKHYENLAQQKRLGSTAPGPSAVAGNVNALEAPSRPQAPATNDARP